MSWNAAVERVGTQGDRKGQNLALALADHHSWSAAVTFRPPQHAVARCCGLGMRKNDFAENRNSSEEGSYSRLIDVCISQL